MMQLDLPRPMAIIVSHLFVLYYTVPMQAVR